MPGVLVDAGPLVALLDRADAAHATSLKVFGSLREPLRTAWPVVTEAMHLLGRVNGGQEALWEMLERKAAMSLLPLDDSDFGPMRHLMARYRDRPMDLADAALVRLAERDRLSTVFTFDRDFSIYRIGRTGRFSVLPG